MPAFSGKYYYTLDPKGRLIIPAPFREIISSNYNPKLYVVNDIFDNCLHIYPQEEWSKLEEKVRTLPKMDEDVKLFIRKVIGSAQEVEIDKQGRILVSAAQRVDAGLNSEIVIVGQLDKIDLWDRKEWDAVNDLSKIDKKATAEKLAAYGL
ncbi:MAG TPA: division/cell wall cluster transcriptional repressor MraZ [Candidatus Sulfobium mesophilum]|uniref:Transcriptional regulator MraZ n=1 Tax=Candidatus Sulfobium mesophilum TaxID=2016548 RepID=A0A2U3QJH4_9BACT|nr:Protein MraZ [Candidatus Sulfobium mesophilum]HSB32588.1 division/cell wall cluster transcriptional repressor MraZ [Candidatus Sulfobium mesophilum]